jgi:hypothetical protein
MILQITNHYEYERKNREKIIRWLGTGKIVDGFIIDKPCKKDAVVHSITENGIILIHSYSTGTLITKLIARPKQIEKYYKLTGREKPVEYDDIIQRAIKHKRMRCNDIIG